MSIKIISTGSYATGKILDNCMLSEMVETNNQWIIERTGIETRYIADKVTTEDLAYNSCKKALEKLEINKNDIGLIICSTITGDSAVPSSSFILSDRLEIENAICFDVNAACSGFIYSLAIAKSLIESSNFKYAIVVGSERLSKYVDWKDRSTCVLFGDGAGCAILENTSYKDSSNPEKENINSIDLELIDSIIGGQCDKKRYLTMNSKKSIIEEEFYIKMNGRQIYKFATDIGVKIIEDLLKNNNINKDDVCLLIPHQSNLRIIETLAAKSDINIDRWFINLNKYGNTSSASVPIAMDEAIRSFDLKKNKGKYVIILAFGGGLSYGGSLLKVN